MVEDIGFRSFVKALNSTYKLHSRQIISASYIPSLYEGVLCSKAVVKDVSKVSLTTDCWTSVNNESFMGITILSTTILNSSRGYLNAPFWQITH